MTYSTLMSSRERLSVSPGGRPTAYQSTRRLIKGDCGWRSATEIGPRLRKDRLTRDNQSCTVSCTGGSKLAAVLVNAQRYEEDMAELEQYRRQRRKERASSFSTLMEVVGDLEEGS